LKKPQRGGAAMATAAHVSRLRFPMALVWGLGITMLL
jgi:hypothetical protein